MQTPVIRYSLTERGRHHTGQPRQFNVRAIVDAINSPACQETVSTRGMLGFYGHLPRVRYGMHPIEGGIEGGKYAPVEPAFVTTMLRANPDGTVEHQAEFLDTATGKLAAKLWDSKIGGFSSAIDQGKPEFFGFDYVNQPNFIGNSYRGVVLDDALSGRALLTYDDVLQAEQDERMASLQAVFDGLTQERAMLAAALDRAQAENEQLLSMLASAKPNAVDAALDAAFRAPIPVGTDVVDRMRRDASLFRSAELPAIVPTVKPSAQTEQYEHWLRKLGKR